MDSSAYTCPNVKTYGNANTNVNVNANANAASALLHALISANPNVFAIELIDNFNVLLQTGNKKRRSPFPFAFTHIAQHTA